MADPQNANLIRRLMAWFQRQFASESEAPNEQKTDTGLQIHTSPQLWPYEMFALEYERRAVIADIHRILQQDPRTYRALHTMASGAVRRGITLQVTPKAGTADKVADQAQQVLDQLLVDTRLNAKIGSFSRMLLAEGDLFQELVVDDLADFPRIVGLKRIPAITMHRNDDMLGNFPDPQAAFTQIDPISLVPLTDMALWQCNHVRWNHEDGERYGQSQLLQVRGYAKKLAMADDDLVVRRRTRATQRRLHTVGTPDKPAPWSDVEEYKAHNSLTKPGVAAVTTDIFSNGLATVETLDGDANLGDIQDIQHLEDALFLGTGVPPGLLGMAYRVSHDVLDRQQQELLKQQETICDVLERGDGGAFSGLQSIFAFALSLAGINPDSVVVQVNWVEKSQETAADRLQRVITARAAQPVPIISQKTALAVVAADFGIDNVDAELEELDEEQAKEKREQTTEQSDLNPVKPSPAPLAKGEVVAGAKPQAQLEEVMDPFGAAGMRTPDMIRLEEHMAGAVHHLFADLHRSYVQDTGLWMYMGGDRLSPVPPTARPWPLQDESQPEPSDNEPPPTPPTTWAQQVMTAEFARWLTRRAEAVVQRHADLWRHTVAHFRTEAGRQGSQDGLKQLPGRVRVKGYPEARLLTNPETLRILAEEAGERVKGINDTTLKRLREKLADAYERHAPMQGPDGWLQGIQDAMSPEANEYRARTISRTELADAYSKSSRGVWKDAGVQKWRWVATIDNRTCPACRAHNGQVYSLDDDMPPLHPNCRCTPVAEVD